MSDNQTKVFLGQSYHWSKASLELHDRQPLHSGVYVYLPGWSISMAYVTHIAPGGLETKYRIPLKWTAGEKTRLCQLCIDHDFLTIQPDERPGIPDEPRPTLTLTNHKNERHTVAKWAGVSDARFDAIYEALLALADRTREHQPIPTRFRPWQKTLLLGGLGLGALALSGVAYGVARQLAAAWWPAQSRLLVGCMLLLLAGIPLLTRRLAWRERHRYRGDQLFSNPPLLPVIALLFFLALIGSGELLWAGIQQGWTETAVSVNQSTTVVLFTLTVLCFTYTLILAAAWIGPTLLRLIEERF